MDGQRSEPDGRRPGSTAEHARLVLLCALQRAAPIVEVGNGQQAAGGGGSRGVSLGLRQDCAQADVINHLPAGVGEPYIPSSVGGMRLALLLTV